MGTPPYMIQLCQHLFHSDFNKDEKDDEVLYQICTNWFNDAFEHCFKMLTVKPGCTVLWSRIVNLKKFIFQEKQSALLSSKNPMALHPDLLTLSNCQELFEKVIKDYIYQTPQLMIAKRENQALWHILWVILEIVVCLGCLFGLKTCFHKLRNITFRREQPKTDRFSEKLVQYCLKKSMKRILYETKYLSVVPVVDPILFEIGCPVIALKINRTQFVHIERLFAGSMATCENPSDAEYAQFQATRQLQRFFRNSGKHLLIISIDFESIEDVFVETANKRSSRYYYQNSYPVYEKKIGIQRKTL